MPRTSLFLPFIAALALVGCSGTEPDAQPPNIQGQYTGNWAFSGAIPSGRTIFNFSCPCTFEIVAQQGRQFSGRTTFTSPCAGTLGISSGTIEVDGRLEFRFSDQLNLLQGQGCRVVSQGLLTGTYSNGTISATRTEQYDCAVGFGSDAAVTVTVNATRQ